MAWTLLLQSVLLGKAREAYSALSVNHSSDYDVVKSAILKAYKVVLEAYRQKFRTSKKSESQTYVKFTQAKKHYLIVGALQRKLMILVDLDSWCY